MRDITKLHPELQRLIPILISKCEAKGIQIRIGECVRSMVEQDMLYAKGRALPGIKVTNAKGSALSSMHQWGVAFDFYLYMDIDGDGSVKDDAFNDNKSTYKRVGKIGKSIGLEWGGGWTSIKDKPHFQLKQWGSTPAKLKKLYGTPDRFMDAWK